MTWKRNKSTKIKIKINERRKKERKRKKKKERERKTEREREREREREKERCLRNFHRVLESMIFVLSYTAIQNAPNKIIDHQISNDNKTSNCT